MKQIVQTIVAVLLGLIVAFSITVQFEKLGNFLFPMPKEALSPAEYVAYLVSVPATLHGLSILGYGLSVFLGAYVGGRFSPFGHWKRGAYITGFSYILPVVVLLISFPRPLWASVSILSSIIIFTLFSVVLLKKVMQNR